MLDFAFDWLTAVFGSNARKAVVRTHTTFWNKQPWALGAFSSAVPGAQGARKLLSEPLSERVWFAGEASVSPIGVPSAGPGKMANGQPMLCSRG